MNLALYQFASCGFCGIVRAAMGELGLEIELRDILEDEACRRDLIEATGRMTVPCLRIESEDGVQWLHESGNIIEYLRTVSTG